MSDLLGRIIGRARGAPSRVEPLLASRHERPAPSLAQLPGGPTAARIPEAAKIGTVERVTPKKQAIARTAEATDEKRARTRFEPTRALLQPAKAVAAEVRHDVQRREHVVEDAAAGARADARPTASSPQPQPSSELAVTRIESAREEQPATTHPIEAAASVAPERPSAETNRSRNIGLEVVTPAEVHVTIGHVELRMAAPPAAQPRRTQPRVTLDDYLRRRNGGER